MLCSVNADCRQALRMPRYVAVSTWREERCSARICFIVTSETGKMMARGVLSRRSCLTIIDRSVTQISVGSRWFSSKDPSDGDLHLTPPHIQEPTIPPYEEKVGEPIHIKRARLQYQSRKRGMLENGLLLSTFAHRFLPSMTESQLAMYDRLINLPSNDWEIYYWATGVRPTPQEFDNEIMTMLKDFVKNSDRENRTVQPNLH